MHTSEKQTKLKQLFSLALKKMNVCFLLAMMTLKRSKNWNKQIALQERDTVPLKSSQLMAPKNTKIIFFPFSWKDKRV